MLKKWSAPKGTNGFTEKQFARWLKGCKEFRDYYDRYLSWKLFELERLGKLYCFQGCYYAVGQGPLRNRKEL